MNAVDKVNRWVGERIKWVTTLLVLLVFTDVVLRYAFSSTSAWVAELEWHFFALIFLLGAAYGLKEDKHVRVDLFYAKYSVRQKAIVDLLGTLLFLVPWCLVIIFTSFRYAENSWYFSETSPDPGGLPARYVIKFAITAGFFLLLLQAFSLVVNCIKTIIKKD